MSHIVESGVLRGRPLGGVARLITNNLFSITIAAPSGDISGNRSLLLYTQTVLASDRFAIVKIRDDLIINVYLPCSGTKNRLTI